MANFNFNKAILGGRLTADPELKQTQTGISVATFKIAVNRRSANRTEGQQQNEADFFNCIAWRNQAEFVSHYFRKGSSICVTGSIQNRSWTDTQNQKRYITEIVCDEILFVDSKGEAGTMPSSAGPADPFSAPSFSSNPGEAPKFEDIKTDDDLPF